MGQKTEFLRALADLVQLTSQRASALTTTLRTHVVLIDALLRLIGI